MRAGHLRSRPRLDVADTDDRAALLVGGAAMGAFALVGLGTAAGWLAAPAGLVGALLAIIVYVAALALTHSKEGIQ